MTREGEGKEQALLQDGGEPENDEKDVDSQTTVEGGGTRTTWPEEDVDSDQILDHDRRAERGAWQKVKDGLDNVKSSVISGRDTDVDETGSAIDVLQQVAIEYNKASEDIIEVSQESKDRNAATKRDIEEAAVQEDEELMWDEENKTQTEWQYQASLTGGKVNDEHVFGALEGITNTNFLMDDVAKMKDVEDDAYTQGEKKGTSLPFIEQAEIKDDDAKGWAQGFNNDQERALSAMSEYVDLFNLDERFAKFHDAAESYRDSSIVADTLEELEEIEENVDERIRDEYDDELTQDTLELVREAAASVDEDLNDREDGNERVDLHPEVRSEAVELAHQAEARAIDRAKIHKDRLDFAVEELEDTGEELQERKEEIERYAEEVEELTRVEGVNDGFERLLDDMGIRTIMDLAGRTDFETNMQYQKWKEEQAGEAIPDADTLIPNAYDALNEVVDEVSDEFGYLDFTPTDLIQSDGDDYENMDQKRRHMEALYDSAPVLQSLFGAIQGEIPDLDQYRVGWESEEYESIEEEREAVYQDLGVEDIPEAEQVLHEGE